MKKSFQKLLVVGILYLCLVPPPEIEGMDDAGKNNDEGNGYSISSSISLTEKIHGIYGQLQLLQDLRLSEMDKEALERPEKEYRNAVLRVLDNQGQVVESTTFERSLAILRETGLYATPITSYLITVDYSAGFGSYSGPITYIFEVRDGRLKAIEAVDAITGKKKQIALMKSLKTDWKIVESSSGKGKDILSVSCRPDFEDEEGDGFTVRYARYRFNGKDWIKYAQEEAGFWENEGLFPDIFLFPTASDSL